jgi:hypothetical protein
VDGAKLIRHVQDSLECVRIGTGETERFIRTVAPKYGHFIKRRKLTLVFPFCPVGVLTDSHAVRYSIHVHIGDYVEWNKDQRKRADLLHELLKHLPNLVEVEIDHAYARIYDILKTLASHHGLRTLTLIPGHLDCRRYELLRPAPVCELLSNVSGVVSLKLVGVGGDSDFNPSNFSEILASMPQLKN